MAGEVEVAHPPKALMRVGNPLARFLLQSPYGRRMTGQALLRFRGRKTGAAYAVVVSWHDLDGKPVVVSPAQWRLNFSGGAPLLVRHRGVVTRGQGVLDGEPDRVAAVVNGLLSAGTSHRVLGLKLPTGHRVTPADVAAIHLGVVRFQPSQTPPTR